MRKLVLGENDYASRCIKLQRIFVDHHMATKEKADNK